MEKKHPFNFVDLTGRTLGNFKVIQRAENKNGKVYWLCECLCCGKEVYLSSFSLTHNKTQSCGCLTRKIISEKNRVHGLRHTRIYNIWAKMRQRCNNKNDKLFKYYGGRGIKVTEEWEKFENFYQWAMSHGYTDSLTIERIDVNGDYEPSNCAWKTMKVQCNNKRTNIKIAYKGEIKNLKEWCDELNLNYKLIHGRITYGGWSVERAFETPSNGHDSGQIFTYNGKTQNLSQWCREYKISEKLVNRRIKEYHWDFARALTTSNKEKGKE